MTSIEVEADQASCNILHVHVYKSIRGDNSSPPNAVKIINPKQRERSGVTSMDKKEKKTFLEHLEVSMLTTVLLS
jgi:uncharacterized protein with von Willebrand factor type A (vWA) domain